MNFTAYFNAVAKLELNRLLTEDERRAIRALWPDLVASQSMSDLEFQTVFIREMLDTYRLLPAHERVPKYLLACKLGRTEDERSIGRLPYLVLVKSIVFAFMHFAETAEVLQAFQPLFSEAEALMSRATSLSVDDFSVAEDELRHRVYRRHAEIRDARPGLIKWDPEGYS